MPDFNSNPWAIMGVARDASPNAIRRAYKRRARTEHPDKAPQDAESQARAKARFQALQAAYEELTDSKPKSAPAGAAGGFPNAGSFNPAGGAGGFPPGGFPNQPRPPYFNTNYGGAYRSYGGPSAGSTANPNYVPPRTEPSPQYGYGNGNAHQYQRFNARPSPEDQPFFNAKRRRGPEDDGPAMGPSYATGHGNWTGSSQAPGHGNWAGKQQGPGKGAPQRNPTHGMGGGMKDDMYNANNGMSGVDTSGMYRAEPRPENPFRGGPKFGVNKKQDANKVNIKEEEEAEDDFANRYSEFRRKMDKNIRYEQQQARENGVYMEFRTEEEEERFLKQEEMTNKLREEEAERCRQIAEQKQQVREAKRQLAYSEEMAKLRGKLLGANFVLLPVDASKCDAFVVSAYAVNSKDSRVESNGSTEVQIVFGRRNTVNQSHISTKHFEVRDSKSNEGKLFIADKSSNGTWINGERMQALRTSVGLAEAGDIILLGGEDSEVKLRVEYIGPEILDFSKGGDSGSTSGPSKKSVKKNRDVPTEIGRMFQQLERFDFSEGVAPTKAILASTGLPRELKLWIECKYLQRKHPDYVDRAKLIIRKWKELLAHEK